MSETPRETFAPSHPPKVRESEGAKPRKPADRAFALVFAILGANALTAFLIQAWMTYGFAAKVWVLPVSLCFALIVALDLFAVMYMVLTYLLRGTGWPRAVATAVFLFAVGAQVFAAEQFGEHEGWSVEVRWFAALPAVFLALSQEGVILWRSHRNDLPKRTTDKPAPSDKPKPVPQPKAEPVARKERPETGKTQAKPPASRPAVPRKEDRKEDRKDGPPDPVARVLAGETPATVAKDLGVSPRAVQIRVKKWKDEHGEAQPELERKSLVLGPPLITPPLTSENTRPVNGAAPDVEVNR